MGDRGQGWEDRVVETEMEAKKQAQGMGTEDGREGTGQRGQRLRMGDEHGR